MFTGKCHYLTTDTQKEELGASVYLTNHNFSASRFKSVKFCVLLNSPYLEKKLSLIIIIVFARFVYLFVNQKMFFMPVYPNIYLN